MNHSNDLSVQFGCGLVCPDGWQNFDVSPTMLVSRIPFASLLLRLPPWNPKVKYGDIVQGLPVPDGCAVRIYSDQVLEHLVLSDFRIALRNIHRVLKPGGVFRFFMPDIAYRIKTYIDDTQRGDPAAMHEFIIGTGMGLTTRRRGILGRIRYALGNSRHQWGWDEASVRKELEEAGFKDIRRIHYRDSGDAMFTAIEDYSELKESNKALGMEAKR